MVNNLSTSKAHSRSIILKAVTDGEYKSKKMIETNLKQMRKGAKLIRKKQSGAYSFKEHLCSKLKTAHPRH